MRDKFRATIAVFGRDLVPTDYQKQQLGDFLARFDGKALVLEVSKPASTRSLKANAYLWGVVYTYIAQETGHSTEELHIALRDLFLPRKFIKLGSKEVEVRKTTTDLTPTEFTHYLEQVRSWAAQELHLNIPEANT